MRFATWITTATCLFLLTTTALASKFITPKDSPLARKEHPRIFMTKSGIVEMREKINAHYAADFGGFVRGMDGLYDEKAGSGAYSEWSGIFGSMRSYALLYAIDPATIAGVSPKRGRTDYGRKAIELALYTAKNLEDGWTELHHGARNLTTDEGGLASLALQVVYDWTHDLSSLDERRQMVDRLITMWENRYDSDKVKLENHYAANVHVYANALCFLGDGDLGASYETKAQQMMDSFQDVFVERQLGVAELIFEGSSDWVEGDFYMFDGFTGIMFCAAAAQSALAKDYFASSNWLKYAPYFFYYMIIPKPFEGEHFFFQQNTSSVAPVKSRYSSAVMNILAACLKKSAPDLAGFSAWFAEESRFGMKKVDNFEHYDLHIYDFFYKFVFGTRHVAKLTPDAAKVPLSVHLGQMHVMRSAHDSEDATLIQFYSPSYWYHNGHNEPELGSLNISRFGTLAVAASNTKNSGDGIPRTKSGKGYSLNNVFALGGDEMLELDFDSPGDKADSPDWFKPGSQTHIGTVDAREYKNGKYDYVSYDYSRAYLEGNKASLARRAVMYLRGEENHEFVVVMDRVASDKEKYFILHTPSDIEAVGGSWQSAGGGHWTSQTPALKVVNRLGGAHAQMYVTPAFPPNYTMHKYGGAGYEWVWPNGKPLQYSASDFSDKASYLLSDHTLQIRSDANQYLTVLQIGDANTMGAAAQVEPFSGANWIGALLGQERFVLFGKEEGVLSEVQYTISSGKSVRHLLAEMDRNRNYTVLRNGSTVAEGSTGSHGTIFFEDTPGGEAKYTVRLGDAVTSVEADDATLPHGWRLSNFPNPFNPETIIHFTAPKSGKVRIEIFNAAGQKVRTLLSSEFAAGTYSKIWNGRDDRGALAASGVYFYRLIAEGVVLQKRMVLMK